MLINVVYQNGKYGTVEDLELDDLIAKNIFVLMAGVLSVLIR